MRKVDGIGSLENIDKNGSISSIVDTAGNRVKYVAVCCEVK